MNIKLSIKKIVLTIIKTLYSILYRFVIVDDKVILFVAYHGKGYLCNPKYLHDYMINNSEFEEYKFIWAVKKPNKENIKNAKIIRYNSPQYFYYLAKSKYWIINCKMPRYIMKKSNQIYVQTWHGTPLKRLAHDINIKGNVTFYRSKVSREKMVGSYDEDSKKYNYFISPNNFSTERFKSAFKIEEDKIIETGYPRNDFISNITDEKIVELKKKYNIPNNKKVILYAPTWRDNSFGNKGYTFELKVDFNLWKEKLGQEYVVIFKPHYLIVNKYMNNNLNDFLYNVDEDCDINELYVISDVLITDYSSVMFDYAILRRPIIFYMYDLEEYRDEIRGFYLNIDEELPGEIITNEVKLLEIISSIDYYNKENYSKLMEFNMKYNRQQDGECCKKVISKIFN